MRALSANELSLNTATVRTKWNLADAVEGCLRHGFGGIAPWRDVLAAHGIGSAARLIRDSELKVTGLCRGGWYTADGRLTSAVRDDNRRAVDEALAIGAVCLVMVVGGLSPGSRDLNAARHLVYEGLADTLDYARSVGMPIAIEPLHPMYAPDRACINTLDQALDVCDALGSGIGVALDVYHVFWDPALMKAIRRAGKTRLLAFHLCDWLIPTRDLLTDRGMMGDGIIDIRSIRQAMESAGYDGLYEVEIFSAGNWWQRDPNEVLEVIVNRATGC